MTRPRRLLLDGARVEWWPDGARILFPDGTELAAAPQQTIEYAALAHALGYGTDPAAAMQMCREHDLYHLWLAQLLGARDCSRAVPYHLAHSTLMTMPGWALDGQESMTMALARFVNTGYAGHELAALYLAGVDLDEVRRHALSLRKERP